jgi:hypothetical protein
MDNNFHTYAKYEKLTITVPKDESGLKGNTRTIDCTEFSSASFNMSSKVQDIYLVNRYAGTSSGPTVVDGSIEIFQPLKGTEFNDAGEIEDGKNYSEVQDLIKGLHIASRKQWTVIVKADDGNYTQTFKVRIKGIQAQSSFDQPKKYVVSFTGEDKSLFGDN